MKLGPRGYTLKYTDNRAVHPAQTTQQTINRTEIQRFARDDMFARYLDNLDTNEQSVIFDIGSYKGESLVALADKTRGSIHGFEPIPVFYNEARERTQKYSNVNIHCVGIGNADESKQLAVLGDATSAFLQSSSYQMCTFRSFSSVWKSLNIRTIDVLHMNVEGGEYDIFRNIIENGLLPNIKELVVQFHYPESYTAHRAAIQAELRKTHDVVYDYAFVWERWRLRTM